MAAASDNPELYAALRDAGAGEDASRAAAGGVENRVWGKVTRWILLFFAGMVTGGLVLIAGLGARIDAVNARIDTTNARIDAVQVEVAKNGASIQALSARMDNVERRLDRVEQRLDRVEQRLDGMEKRLDRIELLLTQLVEQRAGQAEPATPPIPPPETSAAPDSASPIHAAPKKSNS